MLYMRETLRGVKRGPFSLFCLALGGFWCWNWVVFQSPTSLTILVEGWDVALPSRAISLLAFALTACALYAARRRSPLRDAETDRRNTRQIKRGFRRF